MKTHLPIRSIEQVLAADLCLGCGACQHVVPEKITLAMNEQGYLRPRILNPLSKDENECAIAVCPGIHVEHDPPLKHDSLMWGPIKSCQAGWSTNDSLRHKASSGGALSALAGYLLQAGEVDAILHIGVSHEDPLRNEYRISKTSEEVAANAGSRYAPAAPLLGLRDVMNQFQRIAFIGKPCDIVAIRKIAAVDQQVNKQIKYCLAFMCAGVPSIKGTHAVLRHLKAPVESVVEFQYRGNGWPGLATAVTSDGKSNSMTYDDSWGKILNKHLQFRCKVCFDGTGEFSDVACADAWYGSSKGYPSFEEAQGRSLILARTQVGQALLDKAISNGTIQTEELPMKDLPLIQPYQANRKKLALSRLLAIKLFSRRPAPVYSLGAMLRLAAQASLIENIRSFGGTAKRLLQR